ALVSQTAGRRAVAEQPYVFRGLAGQPSWGAALTPRHDKRSAVGQPQRPDEKTWHLARTRFGGGEKVHFVLTIVAGHVIMTLSQAGQYLSHEAPYAHSAVPRNAVRCRSTYRWVSVHRVRQF